MRRLIYSTHQRLKRISLATWLGLFSLFFGWAGLVDGFIPYLPIPGLPEFHNEVAAELFGIGIGVLVIDFANERRSTRQRKEELILQMGSPDNGFAAEAVRILRQKGWLADGNLEKVYLIGANLQSADLGGVNLQEAFLGKANLRGADLAGINLQGAYLTRANLRGADLIGGHLQLAKLEGADLRGAYMGSVNLEGADMRGVLLVGADIRLANLQDVDLSYANLLGSYLSDANLLGVSLAGAIFNEATILPDGSLWSRTTDLTRFTDPNHPNFWRSDNPKSPAYRARG
jgi:hypothetical protein